MIFLFNDVLADIVGLLGLFLSDSHATLEIGNLAFQIFHFELKFESIFQNKCNTVQVVNIKQK